MIYFNFRIEELIMKISLVGLSGCGKTSIYSTTLGGMAPMEVKDLGPTVMYEVKSHNYLGLQISLWDFGGQDHFRPLLKDYSVGAKGALLLFDLTRPSSLENIEQWVNICRGENPGIPIIFLGTKWDLTESITVDDKFARSFPKEYGFFKYLKISSKTGANVNLAFRLLAKEIVKNL